MKVIKILIVMLILVGCNIKSDQQLIDMINNVVNDSEKVEVYLNHNHKKTLFSYYLPKDVGVKTSNNISSILLINNVEVFMSLNVSDVLSKQMTQYDLNDDLFIYTKHFKLLNNQNEEVNYNLFIEKSDDNQYLFFLQANEMIFVTNSLKAVLPEILEKVLVISQTVVINEKKVYATYSNKEEINYQKEVLELFSDNVPEDGFVRDIFIKGKLDD